MHYRLFPSVSWRGRIPASSVVETLTDAVDVSPSPVGSKPPFNATVVASRWLERFVLHLDREYL